MRSAHMALGRAFGRHVAARRAAMAGARDLRCTTRMVGAPRRRVRGGGGKPWGDTSKSSAPLRRPLQSFVIPVIPVIPLLKRTCNALVEAGSLLCRRRKLFRWGKTTVTGVTTVTGCLATPWPPARAARAGTGRLARPRAGHGRQGRLLRTPAVKPQAGDPSTPPGTSSRSAHQSFDPFRRGYG